MAWRSGQITPWENIGSFGIFEFRNQSSDSNIYQDLKWSIKSIKSDHARSACHQLKLRSTRPLNHLTFYLLRTKNMEIL